MLFFMGLEKPSSVCYSCVSAAHFSQRCFPLRMRVLGISALRYSIDRGRWQVEHGTSNAFSSQALTSKNLGCNGAPRHICELVHGRPGTQTLHAGTDHVPLGAQTHGQQWQARDHGLCLHVVPRVITHSHPGHIHFNQLCLGKALTQQRSEVRAVLHQCELVFWQPFCQDASREGARPWAQFDDRSAVGHDVAGDEACQSVAGGGH